MRNAIIAIEDRRFYENSRRRPPRHRPRARPGRAQPQGGAGRLDHRPAVRQERAAGAVRPHGLPEDARGGAGLPPHAQVVQEQDPHRVPELDLLRQRRLRRSSRRRARTSATSPTTRTAARASDPLCVKQLKPEEAALIAGVVANPTAYDPVAHPQAAQARRNLVLKKMFDQGLLPLREYQRRAASRRSRRRSTSSRPRSRDQGARTSRPGCASSSSTASAPARAFEGGLKVHTTLDLDLQTAAETAVNKYLAEPGGPDGRGRRDRQQDRRGPRDGRRARLRRRAPFNLATQGQRQPGLVDQAVHPRRGAASRASGPGSVWPSRKRIFTVPGTRGSEKFVVNNFESNYAGIADARRRD